MIQFDVEGRVIQTLWAGCRLFNIYFPNGQRGQERVDYKLAFYAHLLNLCDELHKRGREHHHYRRFQYGSHAN